MRQNGNVIQQKATYLVIHCLYNGLCCLRLQLAHLSHRVQIIWANLDKGQGDCAQYPYFFSKLFPDKL